MIHLRTRPILTGLLGLTILSTGLAIASPASAAEGDTFTASALTASGAPVPTLFTVESEPKGNTPGTVVIGDGTSTAIPAATSGALEIPETVERDGATYRIAEIGDGAFRGASGITQTGLASNTSVEQIGDFAFARAISLTDTGLAANTSVTHIGVGAFSSIPALEHAALPSSLEGAPSIPFSSSVNLKSVYLPAPYTAAVRVGVKTPVDTYVRAGAAGWDLTKPTTFSGLGLYGSQPAQLVPLLKVSVQGGAATVAEDSVAHPYLKQTGLFAGSGVNAAAEVSRAADTVVVTATDAANFTEWKASGITITDEQKLNPVLTFSLDGVLSDIEIVAEGSAPEPEADSGAQGTTAAEGSAEAAADDNAGGSSSTGANAEGAAAAAQSSADATARADGATAATDGDDQTGLAATGGATPWIAAGLALVLVLGGGVVVLRARRARSLANASKIS